ncbi:MAG: hypothetical protein ABR508_03090 [Candidatus Baltobacteraceae bacterium]
MLRTALAALVFTVCALNAAVASNCQVPRHGTVTLFGGVDDPDVLVWDSQDRLVRYSGGSSDAREFLLPHALLNRPGTKARVVACRMNAVRPKFSGNLNDAIGVLIVSGKYRGRYGWVSSGDVHGAGITQTRDQW